MNARMETAGDLERELESRGKGQVDSREASPERGRRASRSHASPRRSNGCPPAGNVSPTPTPESGRGGQRGIREEGLGQAHDPCEQPTPHVVAVEGRGELLGVAIAHGDEHVGVEASGQADERRALPRREGREERSRLGRRRVRMRHVRRRRWRLGRRSRSGGAQGFIGTRT